MKENNFINNGLSSYKIKLIALFFMLLDHIYYYFSFTNLIPIGFKWVGRIVAVLFIYMTVEGYLYTRSFKKYLKRLYIGSVLMNIFNNIIITVLPRPDNIMVFHSMFSSLFLILIHIYFLDKILNNIKYKNVKNILLYSILFIFPLLVSIITMLNFDNLPINILRVLFIFLPNLFLIEGGITYILIGLLLYINRNSKLKQILSIILISFIPLIGKDLNLHYLFYDNYQWMMVFSVIFIYLYNGKKGGENSRLSRYFFYFFYPIHIYVLYIISYILYR